jgi:hypothetical protein
MLEQTRKDFAVRTKDRKILHLERPITTGPVPCRFRSKTRLSCVELVRQIEVTANWKVELIRRGNATLIHT